MRWRRRNFLLGNPQALKRAVETKRKSLLDGFQNFLGDVTRADPFRHSRRRSFKVGENLAVTPGHVVLRTEMFELLRIRRKRCKSASGLSWSFRRLSTIYAFEPRAGNEVCVNTSSTRLHPVCYVWKNPQTAHDHWARKPIWDAMDVQSGAVQDITGVAIPAFRGLRRGPVLVRSPAITRHASSENRAASR